MHLCHPFVILANKAEQDLGIYAAGVFIDVAHNAEIIGDDIAVRRDLEIALMHIRVEIPVAQRVVQEQLQHAVAKRHTVMARGINRGVVAHRDAICPAQGHDAAGRIFPFDRRQLEAGITLGVRRKLRRGGGFEPQVQLAPHHTIEMFDHLHRAQAARSGREKFDHSRGKIEGIDILAKGFLDPRTQHFDSDVFLRFGDGGAVHLRDRGSGDGLAKIREYRIDRQAELFFDFCLGLFDGKRRQLVLQHAQLHGQLVAYNIGASREHLTELDVGRAKRGQRTGRGRHGRITGIAQKLERFAKRLGDKA